MMIELTTVGVQVAKNTHFDALLTGPPEQFVERGPVVVKERSEHVGHRKGNVLPVAGWENVLLLSNPLLCRFHSTGAAGF